MALNATLKVLIEGLNTSEISDERKLTLQSLIDYIQNKINNREPIRLNFICTHNSRRSHLSQVWAQTLAYYFGIPSTQCYSGGTEATALFPMIAETLKKDGFNIGTLSGGNNPIYTIQYDQNEMPIIGFSKAYDHSFNPANGFAAIMTCNHADQNCPIVKGAESRIPLTFTDPKAFDDSPYQKEKYATKSIEIATDLKYVFDSLQLK